MDSDARESRKLPESFGARIYDSQDAPANPSLLALLFDEAKDADLAASPVILPDFHQKWDMEMPSSMAVATRGTIRLTLTSADVNCGVALVALDAERPSRSQIVAFYRQLRDSYPYPPRYRRELAAEDVVRCALEGAQFAADRFEIDAAELDRIEEGGHLDLDPYGGTERARRALPWMVVQLARIAFGMVGPSNHFVELEEVEEILDPTAAHLLGVQLGQVTLQYHAGGGLLSSMMGLLFGTRKTPSRKLGPLMALQKPFFHLTPARSLAQLRLRLSLYFSGDCPPVPRAGVEGERLLLANALAMNYGFGYRLAAYAGFRKLAREVFGASSKLIVDSPHNSIYEEKVDGQTALVHRHDASRAYPASKMAGHPLFGQTGQALLLPGTNQTSSYLCVASEGASQSLFSVCHGSGSTIDDFAHRGLSGPDPEGRSTLRFRYSDSSPSEVPQLDDRGVNETLGILVRHDLVRPIARLRPFAVLT